MSKPVWMLFQTGLDVKRYLFDGNAYQVEIIAREDRFGRAAPDCEE